MEEVCATTMQLALIPWGVLSVTVTQDLEEMESIIAQVNKKKFNR